LVNNVYINIIFNTHARAHTCAVLKFGSNRPVGLGTVTTQFFAILFSIILCVYICLYVIIYL